MDADERRGNEIAGNIFRNHTRQGSLMHETISIVLLITILMPGKNAKKIARECIYSAPGGGAEKAAENTDRPADDIDKYLRVGLNIYRLLAQSVVSAPCWSFAE